ncbi:MAG: hypothetical protein RBR22_13310 [Desulfuromonas sp.]|nr:hypothetical protein [Desulfuromonas sp.]
MKSYTYRLISKTLLLLAILMLFWSSTLLAQDSAPKIRFIVTKVIDHTDNDGWKNHLIAYGIRNIVNSELYATGRYLPIEDHPEITQQIDQLIIADWGKTTVAGNADALTKSVADAVVHVTVRDFKVKRARSIGLFAAAKTTINISVDIEIINNNGTLYKVSGTGKGVTKSLGVLFQIREDKVHFNETTVGQATQKAIHDAIGKL